MTRPTLLRIGVSCRDRSQKTDAGDELQRWRRWKENPASRTHPRTCGIQSAHQSLITVVRQGPPSPVCDGMVTLDDLCVDNGHQSLGRVSTEPGAGQGRHVLADRPMGAFQIVGHVIIRGSTMLVNCVSLKTTTITMCHASGRIREDALLNERSWAALPQAHRVIQAVDGSTGL